MTPTRRRLTRGGLRDRPPGFGGSIRFYDVRLVTVVVTHGRYAKFVFLLRRVNRPEK